MAAACPNWVPSFPEGFLGDGPKPWDDEGNLTTTELNELLDAMHYGEIYHLRQQWTLYIS